MCKINMQQKGLCCVFVAFFAALITTVTCGNAFAATTNGIVTDANDVRWEYVLTDTDLTIKFYDKPATATTVAVPSLDALKGLVSGAPASLDTYFLKDANTSEQDTAYGATYPRRSATASTTKLDMTNTSKIQILGVKPIIDPAVETELVFGENMVIGDTYERTLTYTKCTSWNKYYNSYQQRYYWSCSTNGGTMNYTEQDFYTLFPNYATMSLGEKLSFEPTAEDLGCTLGAYTVYEEPDSSACIIPYSSKTTTTFHGGAFSGYKLKLTNFKSENFNYVGFEAFRGATFNSENRSMTIDGDTLLGGSIFADTNITSATINTETYGHDMFKDCGDLDSFTFGANVTKIQTGTFSGTAITAVDFSNSTIKTVGARAFENSNVATLNLGSVKRVEYSAFAGTKITELYMPKTLNYLAGFSFPQTVKKVTVAYDTMQSGTVLDFGVLFGYWSGGLRLDELTVLAPYSATDSFVPTHVSYEDYRWHYKKSSANFDQYVEERIQHNDGYSMVWHQGSTYYNKAGRGNYDDYLFEDEYANVDSYKNVIAPMYFHRVRAEKLTIGEGFEFIGSFAFWLETDNCSGTVSGAQKSVTLPSSLKGIGNQAFVNLPFTANLPENLEFLGIAAFSCSALGEFDYNLPNVKYLGDYAFKGTGARDITLGRNLVYMGYSVFEGDRKVRNLTIDFDVFDPNLTVGWLKVPEVRNGNQGQYNLTAALFGGVGSISHYGTITFTDAVQHEFPQEFVESAVYRRSAETYSWFFGTYGSSGIEFDKIDMSKTGLKILPRMATYGTKIGESCCLITSR